MREFPVWEVTAVEDPMVCEGRDCGAVLRQGDFYTLIDVDAGIGNDVGTALCVGCAVQRDLDFDDTEAERGARVERLSRSNLERDAE